MTELGFVVTPAAFADRVQALDDAITELTRQVRGAKLNPSWVQAYDAFVLRWGVERSSYVDFTSRQFLSVATGRLDKFEANYRKWAASFARNTGQRVDPAAFRRPEDLTVIPSSIWIVGLVALALFAFGGFRGRR